MPVKKTGKEVSKKIVEKKSKDDKQKAEDRMRKYNAIRSSILDGSFTKFEDIFSIIPPTNIAKDISISFEGFKNRKSRPGSFTLDELIRLADIIGIHVESVIKLVLTETKYRPKTK